LCRRLRAKRHQEEKERVILKRGEKHLVPETTSYDARGGSPAQSKKTGARGAAVANQFGGLNSRWGRKEGGSRLKGGAGEDKAYTDSTITAYETMGGSIPAVDVKRTRTNANRPRKANDDIAFLKDNVHQLGGQRRNLVGAAMARADTVKRRLARRREARKNDHTSGVRRGGN